MIKEIVRWLWELPQRKAMVGIPLVVVGIIAIPIIITTLLSYTGFSVWLENRRVECAARGLWEKRVREQAIARKIANWNKTFPDTPLTAEGRIK